MTNQKPLIIYDTSVLAHRLIDLSTDATGKISNRLTNKQRDERLRAGVNLYNSVFWIENYSPEDFEIIWVGDDKTEPYWRIKEVKEWLDSLAEDDPSLVRWKDSRKGYKGNRFHEPYRRWVMNRINKFSNAVCIPGYEADDVAAAIVKSEPDREIILGTIDSDWIQMVSEKVTWVCMHGWSPQVRDVEGGKIWLKRKLEKESRKAQRGLVEAGINLLDPDLRSIVKWKSIMGDKSDNLPPGTPEEFIDLFNPPEERRLWMDEGFEGSWRGKVRLGAAGEDLEDDWRMISGQMSLPTPGIWL
jgi:hypothetical protein